MTLDELRALPYPEYLLTEHWRLMRRLALEVSGGRCLLCDSAERIEVHHRTYERRGCERLRDLVVLCDQCHGRHHGTIEAVQRQGDVQDEIERLTRELEAETRGARFLASEVERAYRDGIERGRALERLSRRRRSGRVQKGKAA